MLAQQTTPQSPYPPLYPSPYQYQVAQHPQPQAQQPQRTLPLPRSFGVALILVLIFAFLPTGCSMLEHAEAQLAPAPAHTTSVAHPAASSTPVVVHHR